MNNMNKTSVWFENTKQLIYMVHRYEHCDGDCESCPCKVEGYRCRYIYDEAKKELEEREERA